MTYPEIADILTQISFAQTFYESGRLKAYKKQFGSSLFPEEDFLFVNWFELLQASADFVDMRWDESETSHRLYFSDSSMRRYFAFVQQHAAQLGIRMKDDPYYQNACRVVYDILLDTCPYSCYFRVVTQTHHKYGYGLSVWIDCEQFWDDYSALLYAVLDAIWYFTDSVQRLERQGLLITDNLIPFHRHTESEAA